MHQNLNFNYNLQLQSQENVSNDSRELIVYLMKRLLSLNSVEWAKVCKECLESMQSLEKNYDLVFDTLCTKTKYELKLINDGYFREQNCVLNLIDKLDELNNQLEKEETKLNDELESKESKENKENKESEEKTRIRGLSIVFHALMNLVMLQREEKITSEDKNVTGALVDVSQIPFDELFGNPSNTNDRDVHIDEFLINLLSTYSWVAVEEFNQLFRKKLHSIKKKQKSGKLLSIIPNLGTIINDLATTEVNTYTFAEYCHDVLGMSDILVSMINITMNVATDYQGYFGSRINEIVNRDKINGCYSAAFIDAILPRVEMDIAQLDDKKEFDWAQRIIDNAKTRARDINTWIDPKHSNKKSGKKNESILTITNTNKKHGSKSNTSTFDIGKNGLQFMLLKLLGCDKTTIAETFGTEPRSMKNIGVFVYLPSMTYFGWLENYKNFTFNDDNRKLYYRMRKAMNKDRVKELSGWVLEYTDIKDSVFKNLCAPFVDQAKWEQFKKWQDNLNFDKISEISQMFTYISHGYESYGATKETLIQKPMQELLNYSGFANPFYQRVNDRYNQLVLYPTIRVENDKMNDNNNGIGCLKNNLSPTYCKVVFTMLTVENLPFGHLDYLGNENCDNSMCWTVRYFGDKIRGERISQSITLKESKEKELFGYPIFNHIYLFDCFHFEKDFIVVEFVISPNMKNNNANVEESETKCECEAEWNVPRNGEYRARMTIKLPQLLSRQNKNKNQGRSRKDTEKLKTGTDARINLAHANGKGKMLSVDSLHGHNSIECVKFENDNCSLVFGLQLQFMTKSQVGEMKFINDFKNKNNNIKTVNSLLKEYKEPSENVIYRIFAKHSNLLLQSQYNINTRKNLTIVQGSKDRFDTSVEFELERANVGINNDIHGDSTDSENKNNNKNHDNDRKKKKNTFRIRNVGSNLYWDITPRKSTIAMKRNSISKKSMYNLHGNGASYSIDSAVVTSPSAAGDVNENESDEQSMSDLYGFGGVTNSVSASISVSVKAGLSLSNASVKIKNIEKYETSGGGVHVDDDKMKRKEIELHETELDLSNDGQLFEFEKAVNSEYYRIYCVKETDMVLDVEHQSLDIGAPIISYKKKSDGYHNQLFKLSIYKDNRYNDKYRNNCKHNIQFITQNENVKNVIMKNESVIPTTKPMRHVQSAV